MKMVKSLLLGSAAGLVAVTAGQAADLPVKAKPVEYVKVCSLYGAGFYYMPGTDMCIKVGGWMRVEVTGFDNGSMSVTPLEANLNVRSTSNMSTRSRGYITVDAREQTAYGTARAYLDVGISNNNVGLDSATNTFSSNRAFLQWAGFTAGLTQSFFDFYSVPATSYRGSLPNEDTGDGGWWLWAYTAQLGNGVSATISAEQRRMTQIMEQTAVGAIGLSGPTSGNFTQGSSFADATGAGYGGMQAPDVVANLRVDQTWGSAQVMGALHMVNPLYYGALASTGHPSDTWGWVVGGGIRLNFPQIAKGDYFQSEVNYTQGALRYLNHGSPANYNYVNGNTEGFGLITDCVYGGALGATATGCNLTTAWEVNAAYEHYWAPQWHQSLVGAYEAVTYNQQSNAMLCAGGQGAGIGGGGGIGAAAIAGAGCNMNWDTWTISSRLQWDVTKTFYLGVEALYARLDTAKTSDGFIHGFAPGAATAAAPNSQPTAVASQNVWEFTARMHKDFLP